MNRKITVFLILLLPIVLFTTCKNKDIDIDSFRIEKENVIPEPDSVSITGTYSFLGEVKRMSVHIGLLEDLSDAKSHEMQLDDKRFSVTVDELQPYTTYYYCYSINFGSSDNLLTETKSFMTAKGWPIVKTLDVDNVENAIVQVKCEVISDGGASISERGILWNTNGNPDITDNKVKHNENGMGEYFCPMDNLEPNTTYYVRAYAKNEKGIGKGNVKSFTTGALPTVVTLEVTDITATTARCGGTVVAEGISPVTERGICWSTNHNPTTIGSHANSGTGLGSYNVDMVGLTPNTTYYVRAYATNSASTTYGEEVNFTTSQASNYTIAVSASPTNGGTVTGGGTYQQGDGCTVTAVANTGYSFTNWTENGNVVSTNLNYHFTVTGNRSLVANFDSYLINGKFSINANHDQVYFSKGNLQYTISTHTWSFMEHQYDVVETSGQNVGDNYSNQDVISLFGWGTSGNDHGANCFQPWSSSINSFDYYAYGDSTANLNDYTGQADWGYNAISNGGNQQQKWRTLTKDEWVYVINKRITPSGIRYAKAKVNNINGVILIPDDWNNSYCDLVSPNSYNADFDTNIINIDLWNFLEQKGAVFLPAAGYRLRTSIYGGGGNYWSASSVAITDNNAWLVGFNTNYFDSQTNNRRYHGYSVRLVLCAE